MPNYNMGGVIGGNVPPPSQYPSMGGMNYTPQSNNFVPPPSFPAPQNNGYPSAGPSFSLPENFVKPAPEEDQRSTNTIDDFEARLNALKKF